jgi:hypothetical protein
MAQQVPTAEVGQVINKDDYLDSLGDDFEDDDDDEYTDDAFIDNTGNQIVDAPILDIL